MVLFLIIGLALNFLCGFVCLILNFNFIYVVFMCMDAGVLAFLIPAYVTSRKDEKILEFWNNVGKMPPDLQKVVLGADDECECAMCKRKMKKHEVGSFHIAPNINIEMSEPAKANVGKLVCWCKKCNKKKYRYYTRR